MHEAAVPGAFEQRVHAVQWVADPAAGRVWLAPFVNHRGRQPQVGGDFLWFLLFKNFAEQFVRLHGRNDGRPSNNWQAPKRRGKNVDHLATVILNPAGTIGRLMGQVWAPLSNHHPNEIRK